MRCASCAARRSSAAPAPTLCLPTSQAPWNRPSPATISLPPSPLFADDAQILPQHGPAIRGREEIEAYFKDSITPKVAYDTDTEMTLVRGDLAVEQGRYRVRNVRRGSDVEDGKYLHVWRRMGNDWKLYRLIYNTDVEPRTQVSIEPAREEG